MVNELFLSMLCWLNPNEPNSPAGVPLAADEPAQIRTAVARGLQVIQKGAASYPKHRQCFSCHHQTLPMLGMVGARESKVAIDTELLRAQAEFSHKSFRERIEPMKEGRGIGGMAMTVAYGLWTLALVDWEPDETTEAMVTFLLKTQKDDGQWVYQTNRPPMESSYVTCTVLSAYYLQKFASESQRESAAAAVDKAKAWLGSARIDSAEDRAFLLWGLHLLGAQKESIQATRDQVLAAQRDDGGWAQLDDMTSDAYATGQAMFVLQATGVAVHDTAYQRGIAFLLKTQLEDGSWRVETRSKPIQVFFDNGDPHGEHQFISIPATSWATAALAAAINGYGPAEPDGSKK
jgi:N-acyl-D-amino-acid deacylase